MAGNRLRSCGRCTTPWPSTARGDNPPIGWPSRVMVPWRGRSSPLTVRSTVDLPAPLGLDDGRRTAGDDAAAVEHDHRVAQPHDHAHVVLDHQEGDTAGVALADVALDGRD